ncbi:10268_t:CDS:10 [Diversispora eburnea]|uniref:10268_t:CDS:1 n=1 Tax=Diversispora eburnea TaxID=1213867 RepID=A0A9N8VUI3_9GLOM|nr:10268_t:CDS:10 [Diversispora eburnea]
MESTSSPIPQFTEITRLNVKRLSEEEIIKQVHSTCVEQGIPLVLENYHKKRSFDHKLFTFSWLKLNQGDQEIVARDMISNTDEPMILSDYIDYVEDTINSLMPPDQILYGKDIICPKPWKDYVANFLPSYFKYNGNNDLMSNLAPELRADNLMIYLGFEGTKTPLHKDMCASFGHNLMVYADEDTWSTWYMVGREDKEKIAALVREADQNIDLENYYVQPSQLAQAGFTVYRTKQRIGDFVLVPSECCHEVLNEGGCSIKVSWNRVTPYSVALAMVGSLPSYHSVLRPEAYQIKRVVHESITKWYDALARSTSRTKLDCEFATKMEAPGRDLPAEFKLLINVYRTFLEQEWVASSKWDESIRIPKTFDNKMHLSCDFCHCDIWNRHLHCYKCVTEIGPAYDICLNCYHNGRGCTHPLTLRDGYKMKRLINIYTQSRKMYIKKIKKDPELRDLEESTESAGSLAYGRWKVSRSLTKEEQMELHNEFPQQHYMEPYRPIPRKDPLKEKLNKKRKRKHKGRGRPPSRKKIEPGDDKLETLDNPSFISTISSKTESTINGEQLRVRKGITKDGPERTDKTDNSSNHEFNNRSDMLKTVRDFFFIDSVLGIFLNQNNQNDHQ